MNFIRDFFWFCAGLDQYDRQLLGTHPLSQSRCSGIGAVVFATAVMAFLTGSFAAYTISNNLVASIPLGLFWGMLIFLLDRMAVSLPAKPHGFRNFLNAVPRLVVALLIGLVIAIPLKLKIFQPEIEAQLLVEQIEHRNAFDTTLEPQINKRNEWAILNATDHKDLGEVYTRVLLLDKEAVDEADGSGGTRQRGTGPIHVIKKRRADLARSEFEQLQVATWARIAKREARITAQDDEIDKTRRKAMTARTESDGIMARYGALWPMAYEDSATLFVVILVSLMLIAVDMAPVLMKALGGQTSYDLDREKILEVYRMRFGTGLVNLRQCYEAETAMQAQRHEAELQAEQYKQPPQQDGPRRGLFHDIDQEPDDQD